MFKVGDPVVVIRDFDNAKAGMRGIIISKSGYNLWLVDFGYSAPGFHDAVGKLSGPTGQHVRSAHLAYSIKHLLAEYEV